MPWEAYQIYTILKPIQATAWFPFGRPHWAIENYYGRESLEVANAYYLVGVFYFEQKLLNKAAACFTKSLNVV